MQKILSALAALTLMCACATSAQAGPGDTTWVNSHDSTQMTWFGSYDAPATFPDGALPYRRINMHFTIGRYACPGYNPQNPGEGAGNTGWCGDWDYDVHALAMTPAGDTFEIGRLITPYANSAFNAAATPINWKRDYIYDVTDFYPILKDGLTIRIFYSGYSGGFTGTVRFEMIEGEREHDVLGIQRMWHGSFGFGNANDPIENHLTAMPVTAPAGTVDSRLAFTITGHGADDNYCAEFCPKNYYVKWNGTPLATQLIWRNDCGANELYPQSGTWIYDRGNWCPGASVKTFRHPMPATSGELDVDLEAYTANAGASYNIESAVFFYGAKNKMVDAGMEDILAPTTHPDHYREGNSCSQPIVRVKNFGGAPVTAMQINYGIGALSGTYSWTGNIPVDTMQDVALPTLAGMSGLAGTNAFTATIASVNGQADEDLLNDAMTTMAKAPVQWSDTLRIRISTNKSYTFNSMGQTVSETSYRIYDAAGAIVHERANLDTSMLYTDTVYLAPSSCYRIVVTDLGCDGLSWWANPGAGTGYFRVSPRYIGSQLPIERYRNADFGCGFTHWFTTAEAGATGVAQVAQPTAILQAWPNPANDVLNIDLQDMASAGTLELRDATGRLALRQATTPNAAATMQIGQQPAGVYILSWRSANGATPAMVTRVVIAR